MRSFAGFIADGTLLQFLPPTKIRKERGKKINENKGMLGLLNVSLKYMEIMT